MLSHRCGAARAFAVIAAWGALGACTSSEDGASDASVAQPDGAVMRDAMPGDGDGDGDYTGDGDGDGDGSLTGDAAVDELDASADAMLEDAGEAGDASDDAVAAGDAGDAALPALDELPYAREVVSFSEGASAGFGQDAYPDIVFGPPKSRGTGAGSLDVLSLGVGGEIVIGFGEHDLIDGEGPDFIVFENAFLANDMTFKELGEVAVSEDGEAWQTFACSETATEAGEHPGCAGWTPTQRFDPQRVFPLDPEQTGGNAFDLATLGVERARYVRIRDLGTQPGSANTGGFDLDAIGLIHYE